MSHSIHIHLSDDAYQRAADLARRAGLPVEEWAASRLTQSLPPPPASPNGAAGAPPSDELMRFAGCMSIDDPDWSQNERIDRELAEEYGGSHQDEA